MAIIESSAKQRPLNILCLSEHYLPLTGGTVTYVTNTCENLAQLGNNVYLLTCTPDHSLFPPNKWVKNGNYYVFNLACPKIYNHNTRGSRRALCKEAEKIIVKTIKEINADIVHVLYGHYLPRIFKNHNISCPIFWTVHNVPPKEYSPYNKTNISIVNAIITQLYFGVVKINNYLRFRQYNYDKIISPSEHTKKLLLWNKIDSNKIEVIPNGIDIGFFKPVNSPANGGAGLNSFPKIICVAAIARHKGLHILLDALLKLQKKYPKISLNIIGSVRDPDYKLELDEFLRNHKLTDNCTFITDRVSNIALRDYYNQSDVYVQPSLEEGFCLSLLEAASCGRPIVGTETGAIPEILNAINDNSLCPIKDSGCLARNILEILGQINNQPHDSFNQHEKIAKEYSWNKSATKLLGCYYSELGKEA